MSSSSARSWLNPCCAYKKTQVFPADASGGEVFRRTVADLVKESLAGQQNCVGIYGAADAATESFIHGNDDDDGLLARTIDTLFRQTRRKLAPAGTFGFNADNEPCTIPQKPGKGGSSKPSSVSARIQSFQSSLALGGGKYAEEEGKIVYSIFLSCFEVLESGVVDLLEQGAGRGVSSSRARQQKVKKIALSSKNVAVQGLIRLEVQGSDEALDLVRQAQQNSTHANSVHRFVQLDIMQGQMPVQQQGRPRGAAPPPPRLGGLTVVELASDCAPGIDAAGDSSVQDSMLAWQRCIDIIRANEGADRKVPLPYEQSNLTKLLKQIYDGDGIIATIACVSPTLMDLPSTYNTVAFAAADSTDGPVVNAPQQLYPDLSAEAFLDNRDSSTPRRLGTHEDDERLEGFTAATAAPVVAAVNTYKSRTLSRDDTRTHTRNHTRDQSRTHPRGRTRDHTRNHSHDHTRDHTRPRSRSPSLSPSPTPTSSARAARHTAIITPLDCTASSDSLQRQLLAKFDQFEDLLHQQLDAHTGQVHDLQDKHGTLSNHQENEAAARAQLKLLQEEIDRKTNELSRTKGQSKVHQEKVDKLTQKLQDAESKNTDLAQQREDKQQTLTALTRSVDNLEESLRSREDDLTKANERLAHEQRSQDKFTGQVQDLDKENESILKQKQHRLAQLREQARREEDEVATKIQREKKRRQNLQEILNTVKDIISDGQGGHRDCKEFESSMAECGVDVSKVPRKKLRESLATAGVDIHAYDSICKSPAASTGHDYAEIEAANSSDATYVDLDSIHQRKAAKNKAKEKENLPDGKIKPPASHPARLFTPVKRGNKKVLDHITHGFRNPGGEFKYSGGDKEVASPRVLC